MSYTPNQIEFLKHLAASHPGKTTFTRKELLSVKDSLGYSVIPVWVTGDPARKAGRAMYQFPELGFDLAGLPVSNDTRGAPRQKSRIASSGSSATP
jgi:hypothetical protein